MWLYFWELIINNDFFKVYILVDVYKVIFLWFGDLYSVFKDKLYYLCG